MLLTKTCYKGFLLYISFRSILALRAHSAVILVTHQIAVLDRVDRIIVMNDGSVAAEGTYTELQNQIDLKSVIGKPDDNEVDDADTEITGLSSKAVRNKIR